MQKVELNRPLLELWRRHNGFNDSQAAAELGLNQASYSRYMKGKQVPGGNLQIRMAQAMGVDLRSLFLVDGEPMEGAPDDSIYPWVVEARQRFAQKFADNWRTVLMQERENEARRFRTTHKG